MVRRLQKAKCVSKVVVATSTRTQDDSIASNAEKLGLPVFRGSLENVVMRMWDAVHKYGGEPYIYRAMGDQPFFDWESLDKSVALMQANRWDFVLPLSFNEDPVYGAGVFPWSYNAFRKLREHSIGEELEHAGMWLRRNLDQFEYGLHDLPHWMYRPYRLELDTPTDLSFVRSVLATTHNAFSTKPMSLRAVIRVLDANPKIAILNQHVEEKTGTYTSYTPAEILRWEKDYRGKKIVWSDVPGLVGQIERDTTYHCKNCGTANLVSTGIITKKGDLRLICPQCGSDQTFYASKPRK